MSKGNEEKKVMDEKAFAILTKESIRLMAESAGFSDLPDDAAAMLGEDVSYRLREVTQNSTQYMKHAKRRRLTADDFNNALKQMEVQPVFGYRSQETMPFKQTRDGELHFVDDADVNFTNIALNSYTPKNLGETTIKAHWLAVEGQQKNNNNSQGSQAPKTNGKREVSEELLLYFDNMTKAILGFDEEVMKTALVDLRTNPQIVPLLPYFVNFVANGVKTVSHDINQLTKLLHTVKSLINNPNLYLEPQPYLNLLVQGVKYCVLESYAASINPTNDHWVLRDYAARLLAQIVNCWSNPINRLRQNTVKSLKEVLYDLAKPFCSHYGAVMGLLALGCNAVEEILVPHLPTYWPHVSRVMEDSSYANALVKADAHKVYGAMLLAAEFVVRKRIKEFEKQYITEEDQEIVFSVLESDETVESNSESPSVALPSKFEKPVNELYSELYEYFGDNLAIKLPEMNLKNVVFKPERKEVTVSLTDPEASKTGEELLADLMEQVRKQEQLEREQKERDRIERIKREKELRERLERERIEEERRAEEARLRRIEEERLRQEHERQMRIEHERMRRKREEEKHRQAILEQQRLEQIKLEEQMEEEEDDEEEDLSEPSEEVLLLSDAEDAKSERSDKSENSYHSEAKSEEEEEEEESSSQPMDLAVKSTVNDPKQGIKLTIAKLPRVKLHIKPVEAPRETKHGRRRRQTTPRSPQDLDAFEFAEDAEEYKPRTSYTTHYYSSEGETSSPAHRKPLTLKLKVKDPKEPISD